ncbi:MAG: ribose-5-phosphate isomerase RpiA [Ignavibacteriales bacterium]|nr:ribose-5-phosphate isomerase RpiA [Ignavibacteriales bacterium]
MNEKQLAAEKSIEFIKNRMILGLGTGSTVFFLVKKLAELVKQGLDITCVSTSNQTSELAKSLGIRISSLNEVEKIDLTIDGADEVDKNLNGIKGGGGALLYEKIVAKASNKVIWIVDSSKYVLQLGKFPLPVEIISFGSNQLLKRFDELGFNPEIRKNGNDNFITDSGNLIVDLHLNEIEDAINLERQIKLIPGVVEVGLFNNIADLVIIGKGNSTEIINRV